MPVPNVITLVGDTIQLRFEYNRPGIYGSGL